MAYLLFVDESGHDGRHSPYEVLAGAAVHDSQLWDLICDVNDAEVEHFGRRFTGSERSEMKARTLLKAKTFRLASQMPVIPPEQRVQLVRELLLRPERPSRAQLTALGQAKIAFAERVLELCAMHGVRVFASVVPVDAPRPVGQALRKDYAYLFERFFYFIEEQMAVERGLVVFDELDRSKAHVLIGQMASYFRETATGRMRSGRIIPEPFFVHSDLTTGVQLADLVAYIIAWNIRFGPMNAARREEMDGLGQRVMQLRHRHLSGSFVTWSLTVISDLRPRMER